MFAVLMVLWAGLTAASLSRSSSRSHIVIYKDYKYHIDGFQSICDELQVLDANIQATRALISVLDDQIICYSGTDSPKLNVAVERKGAAIRTLLDLRDHWKVAREELCELPEVTLRTARDYFQLMMDSLTDKFLRARRKGTMDLIVLIKSQLEAACRYNRVAESTLRHKMPPIDDTSTLQPDSSIWDTQSDVSTDQ